MSLIYTASHYLCNPYMYVRTHARCHNVWCVCVFRYCVQTHNSMKYTTDQSHLHHSRLPPDFTCCKKRALLLLLACESVVIKKVSWVEIPVAKWSFLVLLCCVWTVRVVGLIGVQLWGHYEATSWVASSQRRPRSVTLIPSSAAAKSVRSAHLSYRLVRLTFPFLVTFTSRNTLIFSERITPETIRKVDQKYLGSFKMWCWRRMAKINWTDRVRNEVLRRVKGERISYMQWQRRRANWISHILRRNCLLKHAIEWKIQGRVKWREDEAEEVSSYWTSLRKRVDTINWKRKR